MRRGCAGKEGWSMLSIAVCDDEPDQLAQIEAFVMEYSRTHTPCRIERFQSGTALLEVVQSGGFDLYLLDVIMPVCDGIETGKRLRALGDGGEIIFLTASGDYAVESYEVQAFFYLLKPAQKENLFRILDRAVEKREKQRAERLPVAVHGGTRMLELDRILYVERAGRVMRYYCTGETVDSLTLRSSFRRAVAPLLQDPRFFLCGASFVLNLQHVSGVSAQGALLDNGVWVPVPRAGITPLKQAWGQYWLKEGSLW